MLRQGNLQGHYAYFSAVKINIQKKKDIKSVMHWQKEMLHARQKQIKKNYVTPIFFSKMPNN